MNIIRTLYWISLWLMILVLGAVTLDSYAAFRLGDDSHNLIRDMWPDPITEIDCGETP